MTAYFCKDCLHSRINLFNKCMSYILGFSSPAEYMYTCARKELSKKDIVDPVTGPAKISPEMPFCGVERKYGDCGINAKYWTPRKKKDLFKMLTKEEND